LYNEQVLRDETGEHFADVVAAREAAVRGISELIAEKIAAGGRVDLRDRIEIEDEEGQIAVLKFGDFFLNGEETTEIGG
jgi:hypothetical protein